MKIREIKSKLKLEPPTFVCDKPLSKRATDPFENRSFFTVFVGQPRSGKTSHMISALTSSKVYNKVFDHIFVFMPEHSRKSMKKNPFRHIKQNQLYNELTHANLKAVLDVMDESSSDDSDGEHEPSNNLIIIDDMTIFLKQHAVAALLTYIILNRRHLRVSIMITVQYYNSLPMPIRKNISSIVLCNKPVNNKE